MGEVFRVMDHGLEHRRFPGVLLVTKNSANYTDKYISGIVEQLHRGHDYTGDKLRLPARLVESLINLFGTG